MPEHLYIHVPFCNGKCAYCGFYSEAAVAPFFYPKLLAAELAMRVSAFKAKTIYLGGGTPSSLGWSGVAETLECFGAKSSVEATVECSPCDTSLEYFLRIAEAGANRISIGAQSFDDCTLKRIGRRNNSAQVFASVRDAKQAGVRDVGIDLIAGLPGVDFALWRETLLRALELDLQHISVYALSIEPGTPFASLPPPDDSLLLDHLALAEELLAADGFARYEISNYAKPGFACKHNLAVWRGEDYVGIGPAASSRIALERRTNKPDFFGWRDAILGNRLPPAETETLSAGDDAVQRAIFRLRLSEGMNLADEAPRNRVAEWTDAFAGFARNGLAENVAGRWRLTSRGREVCDAILAELV